MTVPVPPKGSARSDGRLTEPYPDIAGKALRDLAALAARLCGAPSAVIHVLEGGHALPAAAYGDDTGEAFPFKTVIPVDDSAGRTRGTLTVQDRAVTHVSSEQGDLLA